MWPCWDLDYGVQLLLLLWLGSHRHHLHDAVSNRHEPGVVRRHHDHPAIVAQTLQKPDDRLGLDVVEVCRRLVGEGRDGVVRAAKHS